jgi:AraC-like DNA-binding protein
MTDRRKLNSKFRPNINKSERAALKEKQNATKALVLLTERSFDVPSVAQELGILPEELAAMATSGAYPELKMAVAEVASNLFLDLDQYHSRKDIAAALGMSPRQLRHLIESETFKEIYEKTKARVSADPVLKAVEINISEELLPRAYQRLKELIDSDSDSTALKAVLEVMKYAGVRAQEPAQSDRTELAKFLAKNNLQLTQVNNFSLVPDEFKEAVDATLPVLEGEVSEPEVGDTL